MKITVTDITKYPDIAVTYLFTGDPTPHPVTISLTGPLAPPTPATLADIRQILVTYGIAHRDGLAAVAGGAPAALTAAVNQQQTVGP
jgi:hypothetical protein